MDVAVLSEIIGLYASHKSKAWYTFQNTFEYREKESNIKSKIIFSSKKLRFEILHIENMVLRKS